MTYPDRITAAIKEVVRALSIKLVPTESMQLASMQSYGKQLPSLQEIDPLITGVHYQQGHPLEVNNRLIQLDKHTEKKFARFPFVMLVEDYAVDYGAELPVANLRVVIATHTKQEYSSEERDANTFLPILYPIYKELLRQITLHPLFDVSLVERVPHRAWPRKFWGRIEVNKNADNKFSTPIDALDLENLRLSLNSHHC